MDAGTGNAPPPAPTTPGASAPPQPSPATQAGTQDAILIVSKLRGIAQAYPGAAPFVTQINDLMRQVMAAMLEHQSPGEAQAPPVSG